MCGYIFMVMFMLFVGYIVEKWSGTKGKVGIPGSCMQRVTALRKEKNLKLSEFYQSSNAFPICTLTSLLVSSHFFRNSLLKLMEAAKVNCLCLIALDHYIFF